MFKINERPDFSRTVTVNKPVDGGFRTETFKATFRVLVSSEEDKFNLDRSDESAAFMRAVVVGLDDIAGGDGQALPYSDALRDQVIDLPYARSALARAYFAGAKGARAGN